MAQEHIGKNPYNASLAMVADSEGQANARALAVLRWSQVEATSREEASVAVATHQVAESAPIQDRVPIYGNATVSDRTGGRTGPQGPTAPEQT